MNKFSKSEIQEKIRGTKNPAVPHTTTPCRNVDLDRFRSGVLGGAGYTWPGER